MQHHQDEMKRSMHTMKCVYGTALPARLQIESQLIGRCAFGQGALHYSSWTPPTQILGDCLQIQHVQCASALQMLVTGVKLAEAASTTHLLHHT